MIGNQSHKFNDSIAAVIITGWQRWNEKSRSRKESILRYDHFAGLCELLPTSMTSLAASMSVLDSGVVTSMKMEILIHSSQSTDIDLISSTLSCPDSTSLNDLLSGNDTCKYPGERLQ